VVAVVVVVVLGTVVAALAAPVLEHRPWMVPLAALDLAQVVVAVVRVVRVMGLPSKPALLAVQVADLPAEEAVAAVLLLGAEAAARPAQRWLVTAT
jgi:hypothetical protein